MRTSKIHLIYKRFVQYQEWAIALFLILFTGGIWLRIDGSLQNKYYTQIQFVLYLLIFLWIFPSLKIRINIKPYIVWMIVNAISFVLILFNSVVYFKTSIMYFYIPAVLGMMICIYIPKNKFWSLMNKLIFIMLVIAMISMVFWVFGTIFDVLQPSRAVVFDWGRLLRGNSYYGVYYESIWQTSKLLSIAPYRNCGVFTEAPMYGFLLSLAYSFYRMKPNQKRWIKIVFIITVISTIGTAAIVYFVLFEVLSFGLQKNSSSIKQMLRFWLFVVIIIIASIFIYGLIVDKLSSTYSGSVRTDHLMVCWRVFLKYFPFGCGIGNGNAFEMLETYRQGMSVGLPYFFACGGVGAIAFTIVPLSKLICTSLIKNHCKVTAFAIAFIWINICVVVQFNSPIAIFLICCAQNGSDYFLVDKE